MVVVLVVIGAAVALIAATKPYPDAWDPRVEPFAAFVEQERGLQFEHPVYVDFIPDAEFDALLTDDEGIDGEEAAERVIERLGRREAAGLLDVDARLGAREVVAEVLAIGRAFHRVEIIRHEAAPVRAKTDARHAAASEEFEEILHALRPRAR